MLSLLDSAAILGIDAYTVQVEVGTTPGEQHFIIVGLPDTAVREAGERVKAAIRNSQFNFPCNVRLVVNPAPADICKVGCDDKH